MKKEKLFFLVKISPLIILILFLIWFFLFRVIYVQKEYKINFNPAQDTTMVTESAPEENIFWHSDSYSLMKENENTFTFNIPSVKYDKLNLDIIYKNPDQQDIFKVGVADSQDNYLENVLQIYNPVFEGLSPSFWEKKEEGDIIFWQRLPEKYNNFQEFINNPPSLDRILTYNYSLSRGPKFISQNPEPYKQSADLIGSYSLNTYLQKGEELNINFLTQNINKKFISSDNIIITVYNQDDEKIHEETIKEPWLQRISNKPSAEENTNLKIPNQAEGVYKIVFTASNNIITKDISTAQKWLVFNAPITLADATSDVSLMNFNSSYITFTSIDQKGLQTLTVNDEEIEITRNKEDYFIRNIAPSLDNPLNVTLPKGNIKLSTDGYISFSPQNIFLPKEEARKWDEFFGQDMINLSDYNYLIVNQKTPIEKGNWLYANTEFDLSNLDTSAGMLKLRFVAPALKENNKEMYLSNINLTLTRKPLNGAEISDNIINFLRKIKKKTWFLNQY
jgi:hypothetical protein